MSPVLVAVASVLGDQMKSKKALYPSCIFLDGGEKHKGVRVGCRGLRSVSGTPNCNSYATSYAKISSPQAAASQIVSHQTSRMNLICRLTHLHVVSPTRLSGQIQLSPASLRSSLQVRLVTSSLGTSQPNLRRRLVPGVRNESQEG